MGIKEKPPASGQLVQRAEGNTQANPSAEGDTGQAIGFLKQHSEGWLPQWYVQLVAIEPDGPIEAEAVHPDRIGQLESFIERHQGKWNLYFAVNPLRHDPGKKAGKADIAALAYYHSDNDPHDHADLDAEKARLLAAVEAFRVKPSALIDTGNGVAPFYKLKEPIAHDGNTDALEQTNRRLAKHFGGDHCHNLDRIMRLPGTLNLPTASKIAKGRSAVPVPATLLYQNDRTFKVTDFMFLPATPEEIAGVTEAIMPPTSIGTPIRLGDYGLPDDQAALVAGTLPKGQRSEVMNSLLITLLDDGHSRDDVLATVHDEPGLVDYCTSKHPGDPEAFALKELEKAWKKSWPGRLAGLAGFNPAWAQLDADTIRTFAGRGTPAPFKKPPLAASIRFDARPITLDELDAEDQPLVYVIEPIYLLGIPVEFSGAHGIGKSINGLAQCCCVASGRDWQGLKTMQGKTVFASWEDDRKQIMRRVKTWLRNSFADPLERAKAKRAIADNLIVLGRDEIDLMLTTKAFGTCSVRDDVIELIAESCQGAILVVLETAALMHGGDELNEDLAQLAKAVTLITNRTGATVVTVRHVSQTAARSRTVDSYVGRGGTSFTGAMRSMVVLVDVPAEEVRRKCIGLGNAAVACGRDVVAFHHVKDNYGAKMKDPIYLVVMPDGHMALIDGPDNKKANSALLLEWLRENMTEKGLSFTKIRDASKKHGVKQEFLRTTLEYLKKESHIDCTMVKSAGRAGETSVWHLVGQAE